MCADATLQVSTSIMSRHIICQEKSGTAAVIRDHVLFVQRQLELPFRVASDCNLYVWEEFVAHYGEEHGEGKWRWASVLHKIAIRFASEDGQALGVELADHLLTSLLVVQPTGETNV